MKVDIAQITKHLIQTRQTQGEAAFQAALRAFAKKLVSTGQGEAFIKTLLDQLDARIDLDALKAEVESEDATRESEKNTPQDQQRAFLSALQASMPGVKTQAHYDIVESAFEALRVALNAYFEGNDTEAEQSLNALDAVLTLASQVKGIQDKIDDNPEVTTNGAFKVPPREFTEESAVESLLGELEAIDSSEKLSQWYSAKKTSLDALKSQVCRNRVFDTIRAKRSSLAN